MTLFVVSSVWEIQLEDLVDSVLGIESVTGQSEATTNSTDSKQTIEAVKNMVAEGSLAEAVDYVNGEGQLSLAEQQEFLESLDGPEIVEGLLSSRDPTARSIGRIFKKVAEGTEISQGEVKTQLRDMGLPSGRVITYLGLFVRVKKHARREMFRGAIASLAANPRIADVAILAPSGRQAPAADGGRKIALLIGVESYQKPLPSLTTPMADVKAIGALLRNKLGYETRILENATKDEMIEAFQALVDELGEQDSLVVFYAGHGYVLETNGLGYWLPADARTDSAQQWFSNQSVSEFLSAIRSKNNMLIADSCYSGTLLSSGQAGKGIKSRLSRAELRAMRSVVILSSGGEEPVQDNRGAGHSVFARQLMTEIERMRRSGLGVELYEAVKARVVKLAPQVPQYGGVVSAGHERGADYLFEVGS